MPLHREDEIGLLSIHREDDPVNFTQTALPDAFLNGGARWIFLPIAMQVHRKPHRPGKHYESEGEYTRTLPSTLGISNYLSDLPIRSRAAFTILFSAHPGLSREPMTWNERWL